LFSTTCSRNSKEIFIFSSDPCITDLENLLRTTKKITETSRGKEENLFYLCASLSKHPAEETGQLKSWHAGRCLEYKEVSELSIYRCQLNMSANNTTLALKACLCLVTDHQEFLNTLFLILGSCSFSLSAK